MELGLELDLDLDLAVEGVSTYGFFFGWKVRRVLVSKRQICCVFVCPLRAFLCFSLIFFFPTRSQVSSDLTLPVRNFSPDKTFNFLIFAATIENFLWPFKWFGVRAPQVLNLWRKIWKSAGKHKCRQWDNIFHLPLRQLPSLSLAVSPWTWGAHWAKIMIVHLNYACHWKLILIYRK